MSTKEVLMSPSEMESINPKRYTTVLPSFTRHENEPAQSLPPIIPTKNPLRYAAMTTHFELPCSTLTENKSDSHRPLTNMKSLDVPSLPPLSKDISILGVSESWFPSSTTSDPCQSPNDAVDCDRTGRTTVPAATSSNLTNISLPKSSTTAMNESSTAHTLPVQTNTLIKPRIPSKSPARSKSSHSLRHKALPPVREAPALPPLNTSDQFRQRSNSDRSYLQDMDSRPYAPLRTKTSRESSESRSPGSKRYYPPTSFVFPKTPQRPSSSNSSSVASTTDRPFSPITPPRSSSLERAGRTATKPRVRDGVQSLEASPLKPHRRRRKRRYGTPVNIQFESVDGVSLDFTASDQVKLVSEMSIVEDEAEEIRSILFSESSSYGLDSEEYDDGDSWGGAPPPPSFGPKNARTTKSISPPPPYQAEKNEVKISEVHDMKKYDSILPMISLSSWQTEIKSKGDIASPRMYTTEDYYSPPSTTFTASKKPPVSTNMDDSKQLLSDLLRGLLSRTYEPALSDVLDKNRNEIVLGHQKALPMIPPRQQSVMTKLIKH